MDISKAAQYPKRIMPSQILFEHCKHSGFFMPKRSKIVKKKTVLPPLSVRRRAQTACTSPLTHHDRTNHGDVLTCFRIVVDTAFFLRKNFLRRYACKKPPTLSPGTPPITTAIVTTATLSPTKTFQNSEGGKVASSLPLVRNVVVQPFLWGDTPRRGVFYQKLSLILSF